MEQGLRLEPHGPYIGRDEHGMSVALYNYAGASIVRDGLVSCDDPAATRRAVRAVRRYIGGPMRIGVTLTSGPSYSETETACEVYGWRAALTAVRAMRDEHREGREIHVHVFDVRLWDLIMAD